MGWEYVARCAPLTADQREAVLDRLGELPFLRLVKRRPSETSFVWTDRPSDAAWDEDGQISVQTTVSDGVYVLFHTGIAGDVMDTMWRAINDEIKADPFVDPFDPL
jgi:hypothetical protein